MKYFPEMFVTFRQGGLGYMVPAKDSSKVKAAKEWASGRRWGEPEVSPNTHQWVF